MIGTCAIGTSVIWTDVHRFLSFLKALNRGEGNSMGRNLGRDWRHKKHPGVERGMMSFQFDSNGRVSRVEQGRKGLIIFVCL